MKERISIRELHHRTGHFVRQAGREVLVVTDRGRPIAEIRPLGSVSPGGLAETPGSYWANRKLLPKFRQMVAGGQLALRPGQKSVDEVLDEVKGDSPA